MYIDLAERLETSKDEAVDVKEILKLLGVIDLKGNESDYNIRIALKEAFLKSKVDDFFTPLPTKYIRREKDLTKMKEAQKE